MTFDGPFIAYVRDVATGELTNSPAAGVHYNTTAETLAEHPELQPYVVTPALFQRVWAGDDPAAVEWTVALRFPDQATADATLPEQA